MLIYGHYTGQYHGHKIMFPKESFLIAGISYYQNKLTGIDSNSVLTMRLEPENKYDNEAIQILYDDTCVGYVPNTDVKQLCKENITCRLHIINIKHERETHNIGIRVILDKYYTDDLRTIGIL